jgi:archaellum component FlaC
MQAKALGVLVANTQKALEQSENQRKANEQIQRVENFVKDLTMDLNNMLAKFYFLKDHKNRKQEQMADSQVKAVTEFAVFVKTLTKKVCSLLNRLGESRTFEEKIDKEIRELETGIGQKLMEFDKALDETTSTLTIRPVKLVRNIAGSFAEQLGNLFGRSSIKSVKSDEKSSKCLVQLKG